MLSESQQSEQSQSYITALEKNLESAKNSIRFFGETLDKVSKEKSELEKRLIETQHALRTIDSGFFHFFFPIYFKKDNNFF